MTCTLDAIVTVKMSDASYSSHEARTPMWIAGRDRSAGARGLVANERHLRRTGSTGLASRCTENWGEYTTPFVSNSPAALIQSASSSSYHRRIRCKNLTTKTRQSRPAAARGRVGTLGGDCWGPHCAPKDQFNRHRTARVRVGMHLSNGLQAARPISSLLQGKQQKVTEHVSPVVVR